MKTDTPLESASSQRDNPSYGSNPKVAAVNVLADDGTSYQFPYAQFLYAEKAPNSALETKAESPPEKLVIHFAVAQVVILGSGLKSIERNIQQYDLQFVRATDARNAAPQKTHIAAVTVTLTKELL